MPTDLVTAPRKNSPRSKYRAFEETHPRKARRMPGVLRGYSRILTRRDDGWLSLLRIETEPRWNLIKGVVLLVAPGACLVLPQDQPRFLYFFLFHRAST